MAAIRTGAGLATVAGGLLVIVWLADRTTRQETQVPAPEPARDVDQHGATVFFGNCAALAKGGDCLLPDDGRLALWMDRPERPVLTVDGEPAEPDTVADVDAGTRYEVVVPPAASRVGLRAGDAPIFHLDVGRNRSDGELARAWALLRSGDADAAEAIALAHNDGPQAAEALGLLGRVALARGDTDATRAWLEQAIDARDRAGESYAGLRDATALAYMEMHKTRRFDLARAALERFDPPPAHHAESAYFLDNFLGLTALNAGDARRALRHLAAAERLARRMGWNRRALNAGMVLAVQLQQLGRRDEAVELLESWRDRLPDDSLPCERADYFTNIGWTRLLDLETGKSAVDPTPDLATAMALYDEHCAVDHRVNGRINLALAAYHAGDYDTASAHLATARDITAAPELRMLLWALDIDARIALARGNTTGALARYVELDSLASATLSPSARWRAAVGRAAALEALGDTDGALAAYAEAEEQLDGDIFRVPLDAGRESLMAARDWAVIRHVGLAMRDGRHALAFDIVRRARSRLLRSVSVGRSTAALTAEARRRWEQALAEYSQIRDAMSRDNALSWSMPADALERLERLNRERGDALRRVLDEAVAAVAPASSAPRFRPPQAGELVLAFHPVPDGWAVFADGADGLEASTVTCPEAQPAALAECLLGAFEAAIGAADRVRLLPVGPLRGVDFHALPFGDDVLAAATAVTYGTDLAQAVPGLPAIDAGRRALIVADARGDLAAARTEAASVSSALDDAGNWQWAMLSGDAATDDAVREQLASAALFHYAGHARFLGDRGWDSELALARDTAFDVADILAMPRVPGTVVLSGCETARTDDDTPPETIGLANAFLAAGADAVIAATRPVDDGTALALVRAFYTHWQRLEPHEALRLAQLSLRNEHPESDWAAYRLVVH